MLVPPCGVAVPRLVLWSLAVPHPPCPLISGLLSCSEEERTRFQELLASPAYRASPLLAIGRQLAEQMQLEGGGQP